MNTLRLIALLLGCCASLSAAAAELRPFKAAYGIVWSGMSAGASELELQRLTDGRWAYQSRSSARGLFRLAMPAELSSRSVFSIQDGQIVPHLFTADDGASSSAKDQRLEFDWAGGRVTGMAERKRVNLPTQTGLLDTMSVQVAVMNELLAGRTPQRFVLLDKDRIKDYIYTTEGSENLSTAVGVHRTVIYRSSRPGSKNGTWFWCAPELGFLPLKVERRKDGDVEWTMAVKSLTVQPPPQ